MTKPVPAPSDWCERLERAIVDGRFLEDPGHWRGHVEACAECRGKAEGLFELRERLGRASLEAGPASAADGPGTITAAFRRYRRRQVARRAALGCVALALLAGGFLWLRRERSAPPESAVAHARRLFRQVFPESGEAKYEVLRDDAARREEYLAALDDPSSLVRRTALQALAMSGVPIAPERLAEALREFREDLESPLAVASLSSGEREVSSALSKRRRETVKAALLGAYVQASRGGPAVPGGAVLQFLRDSDPDTRAAALRALSADPGFVPGEEVLGLMRSDPDPQARIEAVLCLVSRRGAAGAAAAVEHLREAGDTAVELATIPVLGPYPATLALSRERVASEKTPLALALAHEVAIVRSGDKEPPGGLVERAFLDPSPDALRMLVLAAELADWGQYRQRLQEAWRAARREDARDLGVQLALWDTRTEDAARLGLALDICEADRAPQARKLVERIAKSQDAGIRERAEALLRSWPSK